MAERTSTRTTSRRTTPQPVPSTARVAASQSPQKRTTRATRSRSHDISDSDAGRKGLSSKRGAKQGASEGTESSPGQSIIKGRKGRPANKSGPLQDLTTVPEDPAIVYPEIELGEDEELEQAPDIGGSVPHGSPQTSKSPGGASAFSGTTVRTSLPVQDSADPNTEGMLDALPDLSEAADKLLGCLVAGESSAAAITSRMTNLHTKGTIASINWRRHGNAFQAQRELYGSDSYINPSTTLKTLLGTKQSWEATAGPWRPDALSLLQKANLAVLASNIFTHPLQEQDGQFIEELEEAFPRYFTEALASSDFLNPGHSMLIVETFQFALEVRTQYAISLLDRHSAQPNFDSDVVLHQVFYKNKGVLKGWGVRGIHSEDLTDDFEDAVLKRLAQLREAFTDFSESAIAGTERLQTTFPWTSFVHQTVAWIIKRMNEIETQIIASGGNQIICENLNDEVQRLKLARPSMNHGDLVLNYEPPSEASNTTSENQNVASKALPVKLLEMGQFNVESPKAKKAAATLKRRMSNRQASKLAEQASADGIQGPASDIQVVSTAEPSARAATPQGKAKAPVIPSSAPARYHDDGWRHQEADDEDDGPLPALETEEARLDRVLELRDRVEAESNKENIVETQTNLQPPSGQRRLIDRQENATRVAWDSQDTGSNQNGSQADLDEADDFQQQQPPTNATSRRSLKSSNKRTATEPPRSQGPSPKKVRIQAANVTRAQSIAQDRQSARPPASQGEEYRAANAAAKERKAWQVKPPQVRKGWTEEETERLLELIEEHGTSWALLKSEDFAAGHILESRDQVALKDKARNMKLDYLKASSYLPRNFYRIPLSKLQIDKLRGLNIRYDPETGLREDAINEDDE